MQRWGKRDYERMEEILHRNEKEVIEKMNEFRGESKFYNMLEVRNPGALSPVHSEGEYNEEDHNSLLPKREHSFTLGRREVGAGVPKFEKEDENAEKEIRKKKTNGEGNNLFTHFDELIEPEES